MNKMETMRDKIDLLKSTCSKGADFRLVRYDDPSGVSGTGLVAHGWISPWSPLVAIVWRGEFPSTTIHHRGIHGVRAVHLHGGATEIEWIARDPIEITIQGEPWLLKFSDCATPFGDPGWIFCDVKRAGENVEFNARIPDSINRNDGYDPNRPRHGDHVAKLCLSDDTEVLLENKPRDRVEPWIAQVDGYMVSRLIVENGGDPGYMRVSCN